ncbi:MAG TPA: hypothetical protein DDW73_25005 [Rhizobium sp.]|nr:hypothetical protein [Rhizobium sp.]
MELSRGITHDLQQRFKITMATIRKLAKALGSMVYISLASYSKSATLVALEFVREKWNPIFPKRQTQTRKFRVCLVQSEPDRL